MTLQDELIEVAKEKLARMKVFLEELEVQVALGKSEAKEAFERERKSFMQYIAERKEQLKKSGSEMENRRMVLFDKLEALEKELNKAPANAKKEFEAMKKETLRAVYELEAVVKDYYDEFGLQIQTKLDSFKDKLDSYRVQLALGEFEDLEKLESRREALRQALEDFLARLRKEENASQKIEQFANEINTSVEHLKKAFSELFS